MKQYKNKVERVTVDLKSESLYAEPDSSFYRIKRKLTYKTILQKIRKTVGKRKDFKLLEIGTGSGFFMTFIETEFPEAKLTGIEYDSRLVTLTQKKVKKANIIQGNAENFNLKGETFDIIVSFQVIEHLYHPELMLLNVKEHLKPDGIFIFTTPNLGCISAKVMKDRWHGYRDDHVSLKTNNEWLNFAEQNGFKSIYIGSTFFSGIPLLNKFPFGIINWSLLLLFGSLKWNYGESFVGIFKSSDTK